MDVVGLVRGVGNDRVQPLVGIRRLPLEITLVPGDLGHVVIGQEAEQRPRIVDRVVLVVGEVVRDSRAGVVGEGAAELLHADVLAGDCLDDVGTGDEHLAGLVDHDHEVRQCRTVDGAAGGRAHDDGDLRDDAGGSGVQAEDLTVLAEGEHTLLNTGAAGVEDADDRHAAGERELHDLDDLVAGYLSQRAAEGGEVLRVDGDGAAVDGADAGDDGVAVGTVAVHSEGGRAVADVFVELDEAARVDEELDALAGSHLALGVLLLPGDLLGLGDRLVQAGAEVGDLAGGRGEVRGVRHGFHPSVG